jgi:hypothetical protein
VFFLISNHVMISAPVPLGISRNFSEPTGVIRT